LEPAQTGRLGFARAGRGYGVPIELGAPVHGEGIA
jgi:hypothetical protein